MCGNYLNNITHNTHMTNMTLSIPPELYAKMKQYKEIKWSEIAREAFIRKLQLLEEKDIRDYMLNKLKEGDDARELFEF